ncbi:MAG: IS200/IS605 family element transposase accessory protein TnpB [Scytonema sp. RU_4_4]|nr:IS200/IS605 family element transposase accessory protein TnpB [Scytonema sp. RU_4_4]
MQTAYQFKLYPSCVQSDRLVEWQNKIRSLLNVCLADRIDTYQDSLAQGEFCSLRQRGIATPLACSVNKSASLGEYWKENKPSRRRGDKTKPFNPRRSAVEIHSSFATLWRQTKPWYADVSSDVLQQALRHQDTAFGRFFAGQSKFPKFKSSLEIGIEFKPGTVRIENNRIKFPLLGWIKFAKSREIGDNWEIRTCTITFDVDCWMVSVLLRDNSIPDYRKKETELKTVIGCDVGIKKIVALSNKEIEPNPLIAKQLERRLAIRQRNLSRKKKGGSNRKKAAISVAKVHRDIRRHRQDFQWKLGKQIAKSADVIVFEDLNIQGMKRRCKPKKCELTGKYLRNNQKAKSQLNKAISDAAWYSLRKKTEHQAAKLGNWLITVNPRGSSQECHKCHFVSSTNRDKEKFVCENCGHHEDADTQAASVLAARGVQKLGIDTLTVVSREVTTKSALTDSPLRKLSPALASESGNPAKYVQLELFSSWEWKTG